jgi:hypothetical protein
MTDSDKKQWSTPRLRIFVRTRAEERVLAACKTLTQSGSPEAHNTSCWYEKLPKGPTLNFCAGCSTLGQGT